MRISIVTTVHNGEKFISETIESVLSQRGDFDIEYIIFDSCSTDNTLQIINRYKKLVDDGFYQGRNNGIAFKAFSEKDSGMYDGLTKGFKILTGDIIAYLNADDFYIPGAFSCVSDIFKQNQEVNWLTGRCNLYNESGQNIFSILRLFENKDLIQKGAYGLYSNYYIEQEVTFWRKKLLDKIDYADFKNNSLAGDFYLWKTFAETEKLYSVNSILGGFRLVDGQLSSNLTSYHNEMKKVIGNNELSDREKRILQKVIDINEKASDYYKFEYGVFYYDQNFKKWLKKDYDYSEEKTKTQIKLFGFIPFITTKKLNAEVETKIILFNYIPLWKIKRSDENNTVKHYLFNLIPIFRVKSKIK